MKRLGLLGPTSDRETSVNASTLRREAVRNILKAQGERDPGHRDSTIAGGRGIHFGLVLQAVRLNVVKVEQTNPVPSGIWEAGDSGEGRSKRETRKGTEERKKATTQTTFFF